MVLATMAKYSSRLWPSFLWLSAQLPEASSSKIDPLTRRCILKRCCVECARGVNTFIQGGFVSVWPLETLYLRGRDLKRFFQFKM